MAKKDQTIVKSGIGYTLGNMMIRGIGFLTVPLFSRLLSTEEFGNYNVFISYESILYVIMGMALHSSIKSAHYRYKKTEEYLSSISMIYIINLLIGTLTVTLFGNYIASKTMLTISAQFCLILYSTASALITLYNEVISLEYAYKKYLKIALCNSLGNVICSILFIYTICSGQRDFGRILGTAVTATIIAIYILINIYSKSKPKYKKEYWEFGIKYSLPIIPHGLSQVVLSQCDRIMIQQLDSTIHAGIYSLAGNVQLILNVINQSIATTWSTWFYSKIKDNEVKSIQKRATQLISVYIIFLIALISISPELVWLLGGAEYELAKYAAIPMLCTGFVLFLYNLIVPSEYYMQKTNYIMMGTMFAAIINVVLNLFAIQKFGFIAAAYTTLLSYLCFFALHLLISNKLVSFWIIPVGTLLVSSVVTVGMAVMSLVFIEKYTVRYIISFLTIVLIVVFNVRKGD